MGWNGVGFVFLLGLLRPVLSFADLPELPAPVQSMIDTMVSSQQITSDEAQAWRRRLQRRLVELHEQDRLDAREMDIDAILYPENILKRRVRQLGERFREGLELRNLANKHYIQAQANSSGRTAYRAGTLDTSQENLARANAQFEAIRDDALLVLNLYDLKTELKRVSREATTDRGPLARGFSSTRHISQVRERFNSLYWRGVGTRFLSLFVGGAVSGHLLTHQHIELGAVVGVGALALTIKAIRDTIVRKGPDSPNAPNRLETATYERSVSEVALKIASELQREFLAGAGLSTGQAQSIEARGEAIAKLFATESQRSRLCSALAGGPMAEARLEQEIERDAHSIQDANKARR